MNIREVEELTGLVRANIRYYEQEGFFTPERERNGYRNYTEEDIKILKRIKLLRMLEVPIEEIRRVQSDEVLMRTVLEQSIRRAEEKKKELTEAQQICKKMAEDRVTWNTLEADRYLNQLGRVEAEKESKKVFVYDSVPSEPYNLRRYAARWLDLELYVLLIYAVYYLILSPGVHLSVPISIIIQFVAYLLMYMLEPPMLHFFGTTPGKWLMGIRVYHFVGRNLTIEEGRRRTWGVLFWGLGLSIPIFSLIRLIKSVLNNSDGTGVPWDNGGEYEIEVKQLKNWMFRCMKFVCFLVVMILLLGTQFYLQKDARYPRNKGELTKAELAQNINDYLKALDIYPRWELDRELKWNRLQPGVYVGEVDIMPQLWVEETDGKITRVYFSQVFTQGGDIESYDSLIRAFALAFGAAQPEVNLWNDRLNDLLGLTSEKMDGGFSGLVAGLEINYRIQNEGYLVNGINRFFGWDGDKHRLTIVFSMKYAPSSPTDN